MKIPFSAIATIALVFSPAAAQGADYPTARRGDVVDQFHGVSVADPYRWMEELASPELAAWIEAQNRLSKPQVTDEVLYASTVARLKALADLYPTTEPERQFGDRMFFRAGPRRRAPGLRALARWTLRGLCGRPGGSRLGRDQNPRRR
jgi:hypothetical protein